MPRQPPAAGDSRPPHPRFRRPPWHGDAGRLLAFPVPDTVGDEGVRDLSSMVDTVGTRGSVPARVDTAVLPRVEWRPSPSKPHCS